MLTIFDLFKFVSLKYFKKYRKATVVIELPTIILLLITNMLL